MFSPSNTLLKINYALAIWWNVMQLLLLKGLNQEKLGGWDTWNMWGVERCVLGFGGEA
jgi:hypothetical protein